MEQAIEEAVQLHRWDLWTLVPASRPAPPYTNDQRHRVLIALKAFAHLWLGHNGNPAFLVALGPSPPKHPPSVASIARRGVYYVDRSLRDIAHASMHDVVDRQIERLWNGTMLDKDAIPFKALLDDSWRTNSFNMRLRVDCLTTIRSKIRDVARRLAAAPILGLAVDSPMMEKCATVWLSHIKGGLSNLDKWQTLELAVMAKEVSDLLDENHVPLAVDHTPPIHPSYSLGHQHAPSLTSRQQLRTGVSQKRLRARWA